MAKIIVGDLHQKLSDAGIPVVSVQLTREQEIKLEFNEATDEQKITAQAIVDAYDQAGVDAAKPQSITAEDINAAKTVSDLQALLLRMLAER